VRFAGATARIAGRALVLALLTSACGSETLDAGSDVSHALLPVDPRNPVILSNDGTGNWQGLYAVLLSSTGGPSLAGIAVGTSSYATDLNANLSAWQELVTAARASGLRDIPEPTASVSVPLTRPADGNLDTTTPNGSEGAHLIVELSSSLSSSNRPLVVVAGSRLTDVADAYLLDATVTDRVVVVAALGSGSSEGGVMGAPNGELDPWADWIVAERFRYVQVGVFYDTTADLPSSELAQLPMNPLGDLVAAQQPAITNNPTRADQVSILAAALPEFVVAVERVEPDPAGVFDTTTGPRLVPNANGPVFLVTEIDATVAGARLRQMLEDPKTFGQ